MADTVGRLSSQDFQLSPVRSFLSHHSDLVTLHKFTALEVPFRHPLAPGQSQWISLRINFQDAGNSLVDGRTLHELAAPARVRNTFVEIFESAIAELHMDLDSEQSSSVEEWWNQTTHYEEVLQQLGLKRGSPRQVNIRFHHLCLAANPEVCRIDAIDRDGGVVALANSPRPRNILLGNRRVQADVYEFKSGSLVQLTDQQHSFAIKVFLRPLGMP